MIADRRLSAGELKEIEGVLPAGASDEARELLHLYAGDGLDAEGDAALASILKAHGYPVFGAFFDAGQEREIRALSEEELIEGNVLERDRDFERLAQATGQTGDEITVGVLDNGFDVTHPALAGKLWVNEAEKGNDEDGNGLHGDRHGFDFFFGEGAIEPQSEGSVGHGTHVTGTATQGTDRINAAGYVVMGRKPGERYAVPGAVVVAAIEAAIRAGAKVINMSFSMWEWEAALVAEAIRAHPEVLFCVAAVNSNRDVATDALAWLARQDIPNMTVVANADIDGNLGFNTNFSREHVHLAALGNQVFSTTPNGTFGLDSGTSMASPLVANVASKCLLLDPGLKPEQLKRLFMVTVDPREAWREKVVSGGTLNADRAMTVAALSGLIRRGSKPEAAADKLGLGAGERAALLQLAVRLV
jgi:subtilisin family serine protease